MKSPLRGLFFFILNRGILVTIVQVGMLIAFTSAPGFLYWMPFHLCKSKLYTNTLRALLNSRGQDRNFYTSQTHYLRRSAAGSAAYHNAVRAAPSHLQLQDTEGPHTGTEGTAGTVDPDDLRAWNNARVNWGDPPA
ncbi:hypothetical protein HYDPIDRAFT_113746 [Hydnomerulius pinastri MD-312]|uniref:DUF6534 domain-containing protein n=1 Tax=Hydnomerulius pinastri MD-312 TaxID=994086 RepID=A0A0C9VY06_9AGAM|nr:hypothetical protein HYDPIDRAFT_113746 [Hydnomerulius pinastri MD-312]